MKEINYRDVVNYLQKFAVENARINRYSLETAICEVLDMLSDDLRDTAIEHEDKKEADQALNPTVADWRDS